MDCFQDDILREIDSRLERRNRRQTEQLLAWVEILDALGWSVALRLPGGPPILSTNATAWFQKRWGGSPTWEDIGLSLSAEPPARHVVDTPRVHVWADTSRQATGAGDGDSPLPAELTRREREVAYWLREGKTGPEIAIILGLSQRTIENHVARIYRKLGVHRRTQLIFGTAPAAP